MSFNRNHARALLTCAELDLFNVSLGDAQDELPPRTLVAKIGRARRLRDKYRDLLRRQKLATRERTGTKRGATGAADGAPQPRGARAEHMSGDAAGPSRAPRAGRAEAEACAGLAVASDRRVTPKRAGTTRSR